MAEPGQQQSLKPEMGSIDLALFYIVSGLSLRWISTAAATGPSSIIVWLFALVGFFIPLAASVMELSSRYPQEGGLYVWTSRAFGDFSGFMAAWTYWMSNLPYFPGILYFAAGAALFLTGKHSQQLSENRIYYVAFAILCLMAITALNIIGLKAGKWLNNLGAIGMWLPVMLLVALAAVFTFRFGSATHFTARSFVPHTQWKDLVFWSAIFFAFGGCEAASFMGDEIKNARRVVPRALLFAGCVIAIGYIAGTFSMLAILPSSAISGLGGFMESMEQLCLRLHLTPLVPLVALLVTISSIGAAGAFLSSTARLPFVAGIHNYLPPIFGRVHPRWRTPYVAIAAYGAAGMLFAFLGQAGTSVEGAYDVLVSMAVITYFIPYVFLFASMIRLQREPAAANVTRVPGGKPVAILLASIGMFSTLVTIVLSVFPSQQETNRVLAVGKIVGLTILMLALGAWVYLQGKRRIRKQAAIAWE